MGSGLVSKWADDESLVEEAKRQDRDVASRKSGKATQTNDITHKLSKLEIDKKVIKRDNNKQSILPKEIATVQKSNDSDDWETYGTDENDWEDEDEDDYVQEDITNSNESFVPKQKHELSIDAQRLFPISQPSFSPNIREEVSSPISTSGSVISHHVSREVTPSTEMSSIKSPKKSSEHHLTIKPGQTLVSKWATEEVEEEKPKPLPKVNFRSNTKIPSSPKHFTDNSSKNSGNNRRSQDEIKFKREQERENYRQNKINSGRDWDQGKSNDQFRHDNQNNRSYNGNWRDKQNINKIGNTRGGYNEQYGSKNSNRFNDSTRPGSSESGFERNRKELPRASFNSDRDYTGRNTQMQHSTKQEPIQEPKVELTAEEKEKLRKKYDEALAESKTNQKSWADMDDDDNWW